MLLLVALHIYSYIAFLVPPMAKSSRMLKKSASGVLASLPGTVKREA
jgi:hypothetical protein